MWRRGVLIAASSLCLAGMSAPDGPDCGADDLQHLIRQPVEAVTGDLASSLRILRPGDAYTMDHNPLRLNIELDDSDIITRLWCG